MTDSIIQPEDKRFYIEKPDPSFNPRRNKAIIQETIQETDKFFKQLGNILTDELMDRIDMFGSYGRYRLNSGGQKTFDKYIGKQIHRKLVGERIMSRVRIGDSIGRIRKAGLN